MTHTTLKGDCFAVHVLEVGRCDLYAYSAYFCFNIAVVACRRHFYIGGKSLGISILEVLKLTCPCERADNIRVDSVLCPFCSGYTGKTSYALLSGGIGTLTVISEQTCARCKVYDTALCFLEVRVAGFHIIECRIQTGVDSKVKLLCCVILYSYARSRCLSVVYKYVDTSEFFYSGIKNRLCNSLVVCTRFNVCGDSKNFDSLQLFKLFLSLVKLSLVSSRDD